MQTGSQVERLWATVWHKWLGKCHHASRSNANVGLRRVMRKIRWAVSISPKLAWYFFVAKRQNYDTSELYTVYQFSKINNQGRSDVYCLSESPTKPYSENVHQSKQRISCLNFEMEIAKFSKITGHRSPQAQWWSPYVYDWVGFGRITRQWHTTAHRPLARYVKLRVSHAPGMAKMFSRHRWRPRHASWHVRHSRAVMHARIVNKQFPLKSVVGKTFPAFTAHAQPAILSIW